MKIGEFAKKHDVTIDTVRHYISEGLLTPLKENTQYSFSEIDDRVMDSILLLKNMNFKLEEMKAYLLFQTMFTSGTFAGLKSFKQNFEEKLRQNKEEIKKLKKMNELIEKKLESYEPNFTFNRGVPLNMACNLKCTKCGKTLELENPELSHNEILSGEMVCPKCGKRYYIRYGAISGEEIPDIDDRTAGISEMVEAYLKDNDEKYVHEIREFFQIIADLVKENGKEAKNVLISGDSMGFLNSAILRSLPDDINLFIHVKENATVKYFLEDIFPKNTLVFFGNIKEAPFDDVMDYIFWDDYDAENFVDKEIKIYPNVSKKSRLDCIKVLMFKIVHGFPTEEQFLADMKEKGWEKTGEMKTERVVKTKESSDFSMIDKNAEFEVQFGVYSFKTLG